jgi:hypothetical protein
MNSVGRQTPETASKAKQYSSVSQMQQVLPVVQMKTPDIEF